MTTNPIAAARALLEPLTGCTSGPWSKISAGSNSYHIGSGGWTVDASDPDGGYFEEYHICKTTGYYDAAGADARLIAAAPDLRDMIATLADALEAERARAEKAEAVLDHTQQWYAERVRKIEDVAKREGLWPEIAAILANGSATRQIPDGSFVYDPPTYAQQLNTAKHRAKKAEAERDQALVKLAAAFEVAAELSEASAERNKTCPSGCRCADGWHIAMRIRALIPADAQAAIDKMLARARLEGWRAGRDAAADACDWGGIYGNKAIQAIRALPEPKEASHV